MRACCRTSRSSSSGSPRSLAHNEAVIGDAGYPMMYGLMALSVVGAIGAWGIAQRLYGAERPQELG